MLQVHGHLVTGVNTVSLCNDPHGWWLFSRSVVSWLFSTPWTAAHQASLSFTFSQSLLKLMSIEMPSNHLILWHALPLLPSVFPSIQVFSIESALCIRWPKYWSISINPSNEYSGLISFWIDSFGLLTVPQKRVDICICLTGSLCWTAKSNTTIFQENFSKNKTKQNRKKVLYLITMKCMTRLQLRKKK